MDWEKFRKNLRDGASTSIDKIEEFTKIGKLKIDELAAKRKIERNFADIGERAFDLIEESKGSFVEADIAVKKAIGNVVVLKRELVAIAVKIAEIQNAGNKEKACGPVTGKDDITGI